MTKRGKARAEKKAASVSAPDFPRQETTDFDDPDQHAVWALAGLSNVKGAPLFLPAALLRWISRRLWDCGFRFQPELQTIKYRPPHAGQGEAMFRSAGEWVPIDTPDDEAVADPADAVDAARSLPPEARDRLIDALGLRDSVTLTGPQPGDDERVPYLAKDGSTRMVTRAQARAYANARAARRRRAQGGGGL